MPISFLCAEADIRKVDGHNIHGFRFARWSCTVSVTWLHHPRRREQVVMS